jgi:hypothetical protein
MTFNIKGRNINVSSVGSRKFASIIILSLRKTDNGNSMIKLQWIKYKTNLIFTDSKKWIDHKVTGGI